MTNRTFPLWPLAVALLAALLFSGAFSNACGDVQAFQQQMHKIFK